MCYRSLYRENLSALARELRSATKDVKSPLKIALLIANWRVGSPDLMLCLWFYFEGSRSDDLGRSMVVTPRVGCIKQSRQTSLILFLNFFKKTRSFVVRSSLTRFVPLLYQLLVPRAPIRVACERGKLLSYGRSWSHSHFHEFRLLCSVLHGSALLLCFLQFHFLCSALLMSVTTLDFLSVILSMFSRAYCLPAVNFSWILV